ncbi:hypothetical protein ACEQ8H_007769 [Pleosporales sp. CAS-2024a]
MENAPPGSVQQQPLPSFSVPIIFSNIPTIDNSSLKEAVVGRDKDPLESSHANPPGLDDQIEARLHLAYILPELSELGYSLSPAACVSRIFSPPDLAVDVEAALASEYEFVEPDTLKDDTEEEEEMTRFDPDEFIASGHLHDSYKIVITFLYEFTMPASPSITSFLGPYTKKPQGISNYLSDELQLLQPPHSVS